MAPINGNVLSWGKGPTTQFFLSRLKSPEDLLCPTLLSTLTTNSSFCPASCLLMHAVLLSEDINISIRRC